MKAKKYYQGDSLIKKIPFSRLLGTDVSYACGYGDIYHACVVDGVTRDLPNGEIFSVDKIKKNPDLAFPYYKELRKLRRFALASAATFVLSKENTIQGKIYNMNCVWGEANQFEVDYLGKNFYSATASGVSIVGDDVSIFNIGDANVLFVKENGMTLFEPLPDLYTSGMKIRSIHMKLTSEFEGIKDDWNDKECRCLFRKTFPNGNALGSFGVLDGSNKALDFTTIQHYSLEELQREGVAAIYVYTNGNITILSDNENRKNILQGSYPKVEGKERTLLVIKVPMIKEKQKVFRMRTV